MEPRSDRHDDDLALARAVASGEREAFVAFFERFFGPVFAFAARRARDEAAAERLTERILHAAVESLEGWTGGAPLAARVLAVARLVSERDAEGAAALASATAAEPARRAGSGSA